MVDKSEIRSFLLKHQSTPWKRGEHDCVMFIHKFLRDVWGKPFADPSDYTFYDFRTAFLALKKICSDNKVENFNQILSDRYYQVDLPVEGGIIAKKDHEGLTGYTYGVCHDGFGYFSDKSGLIALELNPSTDLYWSVE